MSVTCDGHMAVRWFGILIMSKMALEPPFLREQNQRLKIPLDLTEWVKPAQLREWIVSNVATLEWTNAELIELLKVHTEFEPRALLNTMTFAYAVGIFGAEEMARSCSTDPDFRNIRPELPPLVSDLKEFRKQNRGIVKWALANVITRALKSQFIEGPAIEVLPVGLRHHVVDNAIERLEHARRIDSP
jgi:hypothetical protein